MSGNPSINPSNFYGVDIDNIFVMKSMMRKNPMFFVSTMFMLGIMFFGYALQIAEAPLSRNVNDMDHSSFASCCWEAILVMTTGK